MSDYARLLLYASRALHDAGLLLSVALHPGQFLPRPAYDAVDRVNLMAYDMVNGNGAERHHAPFEMAAHASSELIRSGCPPSKVILGIPAYGRHSSYPQAVKSYSEIVDDIDRTEQQPGPRMLNGQFNGYHFDSPDDVQRKVKYAISKGLGGAFFWEIGQDYIHAELAPGGLLLGAAASAAIEEFGKTNLRMVCHFR